MSEDIFSASAVVMSWLMELRNPGLGVDQRHIGGIRGDAVPEVLGELDALGHGQFADVDAGGLHVLSPTRLLGSTGSRRVLPARPLERLDHPRGEVDVDPPLFRERPAGSRHVEVVDDVLGARVDLLVELESELQSASRFRFR